jgi:hypothetical protein
MGLGISGEAAAQRLAAARRAGGFLPTAITIAGARILPATRPAPGRFVSTSLPRSRLVPVFAAARGFAFIAGLLATLSLRARLPVPLPLVVTAIACPPLSIPLREIP